MAQWHTVKSALSIGFVAGYVARAGADVVAVLLSPRISALPVWLAVHQKIGTSSASGRCTISREMKSSKRLRNRANAPDPTQAL